MSTLDPIRVRVDFGRITMIPVSATFLIANLLGIYRTYMAPESVDVLGALRLINSLLVACFYVLMVSAYLMRTSARRISRSFTANAVAVIATSLPLPLLGLLAANVQSDIRLMIFGFIVTVGGLGFSLYSLHTLGRSFSIIPQARTLVKSGPYKYLRHPLYVGEIVATLGFVLSHLTPATIAVLAVLVALQIYRAVQEEKVLASTFSEYEGYMSRTYRWVPGIF